MTANHQQGLTGEMAARLGEFLESEQDGSERAELCLSRELARAWAVEAGFDEAGVVALPYADDELDAERFEEWVRSGRAGRWGT